MISIYTLTMGRELYLKRLIESIRMLGGNGEFEHHVCFQGSTPSDEFSDYLQDVQGSYPLITHFWDKNHGTCRGSNKILSQLEGEIILKLDDDAVLRSSNFLEHVRILCGLIPNLVFSPFPVGLIGHFGGLSSANLASLRRMVKYSEESDTYYTLRQTNLVGGLARASLAKVIKRFKWPEDSDKHEDVHFSRFCIRNNIPMCYLENALIVEHQESTLGQEQRYGGNMPSVVKKSEKPKISVIVTTYNRENSILNALESIHNQYFKDYEVIVVDDCSTDNTEEVVKKYIEDKKKFNYFRLNENHGYHSYPKNFGVNKLSKAPYIAFLDDDDLYSMNSLSFLYNKAVSSKADVVYGGYIVRDEETGKEANGVDFEFSRDLLIEKNFLVTSSVLIKKSSFLAVGGFDEKVSRFSDWHLWLRMDKAGSIFHLTPEKISAVRTNGKDSMTKKYDIYTDAKGNIVSHPYFDIMEFKEPSKDKAVEPKPISTVSPTLVSIVIPVFNRPDLTKVCLDTISDYTSYPFELILVQEGTDPEVTKLLRSYDTKFVHNEDPKGFAGAMNSGYKLAEGSHVCFLNNDIVAIPKWLTYMMEAFERDPKVGLVTPTYTETKTKQNIDFNKKDDNFTYVEDPMSLKGVCFLISREALDNVGIWDESFGLGGGEDNDMCIRLDKAGYKLVIARKSFIYHYGSAAFRELFDNDIPYSKKYAVGQFQKVRKKWNFDKAPRVRIAIPCQSGWIWHELALRLTQWSHSQTFKMGYKYYPFLSPLDNARNLAVKDFLEDYWDYLVFIDDDIIPPPETIDLLLETDKDIIAPLCLTIKSDDKNMTFPMPVAHRYDENHQYRPYYGQGVEETDVITGGMFMVKREIYEKLERPFYFTYHKDGTVEYSEDFVFSQQCQSLGYKLYTHFGVICEHMKTIGVKSFNDALVITANRLKGEDQVKSPSPDELEILRKGLPSRRVMGG